MTTEKPGQVQTMGPRTSLALDGARGRLPAPRRVAGGRATT